MLFCAICPTGLLFCKVIIHFPELILNVMKVTDLHSHLSLKCCSFMENELRYSLYTPILFPVSNAHNSEMATFMQRLTPTHLPESFFLNDLKQLIQMCLIRTGYEKIRHPYQCVSCRNHTELKVVVLLSFYPFCCIFIFLKTDLLYLFVIDCVKK